jgi:Lectin C-type domain
MPRFILTPVVAALVTLVTLVAGEDRILEKLDEADRVYSERVDKVRADIVKSLEKREAAVVKAGDKKALDRVRAERKAFESVGTLPSVVPTVDYQRAIRKARTDLEVAYSRGIRDYTKARMLDKAEAAEKKFAKILKKGSVPADAEEFLGKYYKVFADRVTWYQAEAKCESLGGHLAIVTDERVNRFLTGLLKKEKIGAAWLGATDERIEGRWVWVNGRDLTFNNWGRGQPNNVMGIEHYAALDADQDGIWWDLANRSSDVMPDLHPGIICEWDLP